MGTRAGRPTGRLPDALLRPRPPHRLPCSSPAPEPQRFLMSDKLTEDVTRFQGRFSSLKAEVGKVLVGQDDMLHRLILGLLAGGHVLLEGVPGLAKTLRDPHARRRARRHVLADPVHARTCCPPTSSARRSTTRARARTRSRRARCSATSCSPTRSTARRAKVQSALLEAMQERQVTLGDQTFRLAEPFLGARRRRTRSSRRAPIRCPRRSSTASC